MNKGLLEPVPPLLARCRSPPSFARPFTDTLASLWDRDSIVLGDNACVCLLTVISYCSYSVNLPA